MQQLVQALRLFPVLAIAFAIACGTESDRNDAREMAEPDTGAAEGDAGLAKPEPIDGAARMAECVAKKSPGECWLDATDAFVEVTETQCGGPRGVWPEGTHECFVDVFNDLDQDWVSCTALHEWLLAECAGEAACDEARIQDCHKADARYENCDASKLGIKISEIFEMCDSD